MTQYTLYLRHRKAMLDELNAASLHIPFSKGALQHARWALMHRRRALRILDKALKLPPFPLTPSISERDIPRHPEWDNSRILRSYTSLEHWRERAVHFREQEDLATWSTYMRLCHHATQQFLAAWLDYMLDVHALELWPPCPTELSALPEVS